MPLRSIARLIVVVFVVAQAASFAIPAKADVSNILAVRVAKAIASFAGYTASKSRIMDYELVDQKERPAYPGYLTVQVLSNAHAIFSISVNSKTGQVADFLGCYVFEYPIIRKTERSHGFANRERLDYGRMMGNNGCDTYVILRHPGDESRSLPRHNVEAN